jgi:hypothetical protein
MNGNGKELLTIFCGNFKHLKVRQLLPAKALKQADKNQMIHRIC